MASERVQRHIDRLLDQAEEAMESLNWDAAHDFAQAVLGLDPGNADALAYLDSAQRVQENQPSTPSPEKPIGAPPADQPTSFASGRYEVKRFLGEGGKKKV